MARLEQSSAMLANLLESLALPKDVRIDTLSQNDPSCQSLGGLQPTLSTCSHCESIVLMKNGANIGPPSNSV